MNQSKSKLQSFLPLDIALKIVSSLQVLDVCSLGSCSRFWRELCGSDCIWEWLFRERWPSIAAGNSHSSSSETIIKGWREAYIKRHRQMEDRANSVVEFVDHCSSSAGSLEVGDYYRAVQNLCSIQLEFRDIQLFLFKPKLSVLLNLIGLYYSIFCLKVPAVDIMDALMRSKISDRQVCVKWWKLGRWFYGFRMRDESHSRCVSLEDLMKDKGEEVLGVIHRGAIHEVIRVEIAISNTTSTPWSCQSTYPLA